MSQILSQSNQTPVPTGIDLAPADSRSLWTRGNIVFVVMVFAVSFAFFATIIALDIDTDIQAHAGHVAAVVAGKNDWPPNFLYYVFIHVVSGFTGDALLLDIASTIVLATSVAFKASLTLYIIKKINPSISSILLLTLATSLLLSFALPGPGFWTRGYYYLGQITPTVWHNSTTIFLFPFALALFWMQARTIHDDTTRHCRWLFVLVALNIFIKPSFFLAFLPAVAVMLFLKFGVSRRAVLHASPALFGFLLIGLQYYLIYYNQLGSMQSESSGIAFGFLEVWSSNINVYLIIPTIIVSFIFPIMYYGLINFQLDVLSKFSILISIFSVLIFALLKETGPRFVHGNFYWQNVIAIYILFTVLSANLSKAWSGGNWNWKATLCASVFVLHAVSGGYYIVRILTLGRYL